MMKDILSKKSWSDCGVPNELKEILMSKGFKKPSKIQSASLVFFTRNNTGNLIGQAKNGSGKTLAFLLPSIIISHENMKKDKAYPKPKISSPYVIIIGDSKELCYQIRNVCDVIKIPEIETDFQTRDVENDQINTDCHIMTVTSGRFSFMIRKRYLSLDRLKLLIVDECDKILNNDKFRSSISSFNKRFPADLRVGLFSATFTPETMEQVKVFNRNFAEIKFKNKEEIVLRNLTHYYVQCSRSEKLEFLDSFLGKFLSTVMSGSVIIFVNTRAFAERFAMALNEKGHKSEILLGDMDMESRKEILDEFKQGKIRILFSTNLISRGIDNRKVGLVINLDMPQVWNPDRSLPKQLDRETYFHRVGRTGRFGDYGLALNVVDDNQMMGELNKVGMAFGINLIEVTMENFVDIINKNTENYLINQKKRETLNEDNI